MGQPSESSVATTCGYCGVGCRLEAHVSGRRAGLDHPVQGGARQPGPRVPEGALRPPLRVLPGPPRHAADPRRLRGCARPAGRRRSKRSPRAWRAIRDQHGADAIAGLASSRATNEDCFAMARLMRAAIGTNNIDNCSRVCHSPTSFALRRSFGLSGATGSFSDIDAADAAIIIGANPTQAHPVVGARIKQAALRGLKLVTIDPRRIELADYGELHLAPRPGTNAAVLLGLAHVLVAGRPARRALHRRAHRGQRGDARAARAVHAGGGPGDQRHPGRRHRARGPHLRRGRRGVDHLGPGRHRAQVRLGGRAADLQPRHAHGQGRPARLGAAAAARPEQRPGLLRHGRAARHPQRVPPGGRRAGGPQLRGGLGRRAVATPRLQGPGDVRRRRRRRAEGDVHLRRGRRPDRPGQRPRRQRAGARSTSSSARTSSPTRPRPTRT